MYLTLEGAVVLLVVAAAVPLVHAAALLIQGVRELARRLRSLAAPSALTPDALSRMPPSARFPSLRSSPNASSLSHV
jgi:hypothetical protein